MPMFGLAANNTDSLQALVPPPVIQDGSIPAVMLPPNYEDFPPYKEAAPLPLNYKPPGLDTSASDPKTSQMLPPILVNPSPNYVNISNQTQVDDPDMKIAEQYRLNETASSFIPDLAFPHQYNQTQDDQYLKVASSRNTSNPLLSILRPGYGDQFGMPVINTARGSHINNTVYHYVTSGIGLNSATQAPTNETSMASSEESTSNPTLTDIVQLDGQSTSSDQEDGSTTISTATTP